MSLKQKLDSHYKAFDRSKIEPDPLQFLHLFKEENDIEAMGFIASIFAYGNVRQINNSLKQFLDVCNSEPYEFIVNFNMNSRLKLSHRFYTAKDVKHLFCGMKKIYNKYGSLKKLFYICYKIKEGNMKDSISCISKKMLEKTCKENIIPTAGLKFMFPLPEKGSACKRMNLFLRWMIRKDKLDFGIWDEIPTSKLIIPVDTHIAKISRQLGLTARKNPDWKMAEEITNNLKEIDPDDPVKYDFALCHIGMRNLSF